MFIDTRELPGGEPVRADVCIVGAGAAGIALALEFLDGPIRVVLLEGGGRSAEENGPGIYRVIPGVPPRLSIEPSMTQYLGGNTNHWFANCRPLEDEDFAPRDWIPYSGWPIGQRQLLPYYERAQALCGLRDLRWYDLDVCRPYLTHQPLAADPAVLTSTLVHACPVASFADLYGRRLEAADNVRVLFHARALRLRPERRRWPAAQGARLPTATHCGAPLPRLRVCHQRQLVPGAGRDGVGRARVADRSARPGESGAGEEGRAAG